MVKIEVCECSWDIYALYANATTPATRGLMGYMLYTGRTDNVVLGGAFALLLNLDQANEQVYRLKYCCHPETAREIIAIAEVAKAGGFKKFALSRRNLQNTRKQLETILD